MSDEENGHPIAKALKRKGENQRWLAEQMQLRGARCNPTMVSHVLQGIRHLSDRNKRVIADIFGPAVALKVADWQMRHPLPPRARKAA